MTKLKVASPIFASAPRKKMSEIRNVSSRATKQFNNINSQLDATIIILLIISISSTCFGR
jgi:hypothetical protein